MQPDGPDKRADTFHAPSLGRSRGGSVTAPFSFSWDIMLLPAFFLVNTLSHFNLSNTLGHGMVLQRAPQQAVVCPVPHPCHTVSLQALQDSAHELLQARMFRRREAASFLSHDYM